ncbi:MAG TPA: hypothetical protein PLP07_06585 [Pyrinomonadaceae bacterium]|nr:hypothetical protein [Pyrinomonadaceae bacterium]
MLFRPKFCANCGIKIERSEWRPWTSHRFCQVCETEFKGQDLIIRVLVGACLLIGIVGVGGYFERGVAQRSAMPDQAKRFAEAPPQTRTPVAAPNAEVNNKPQPYSTTRSATNVEVDSSNSARSASNAVDQPSAEGEVKYFCGAQTKKGTPCSRKVKGNIRCYQHEGLPAMLPPSRLRIG